MAHVVALLLLYTSVACAEILTPPYFNLALGKKITASATCGDEGSELYCKLVGANVDHDETVIQGQVCDVCDATNEAKRHPPEYAVDGMETWWQSPPLSRGMKYNEVNLTIDLGQEFHVAYVFVRMGNSPRPGLWALEKSTDYGKTFKPWQYFSDSPQDCVRYFGRESLQPITKDDSVICNTEYSKIVPLEGGEIPISLLNSRPSANKYFNSSVLQEWTRATNVRLRLLRTKNLLGHLMSVARQDPTVTRRYFYSIKDISIGGRCMCNGHADTCDPAEPESDSSILVCRCQHNTCGPQCTACCPGFEQKKWRISQNWDRFACEPCNCHNHTTECEFDASIDEKRLSLDINGRYEGGGVCKNCQHNTQGINCNKCKPTYYRPFGKRWDELDVCQPCNCDLHYSTGNCQEETGRCECRREFNPPNCDSCAYGYFDYPDCKPCTCNLNGTEGQHCTPTDGMCPCKYNYAGFSCEMCADGYYSPSCKNCECHSVGSVSHVCDKESGNCTCKSKYTGRTCNQCEAGYFNYPTCKHCNCDTSGTEPIICDDTTGQCICKPGFGGTRCDQCLSGYYMEVRGRERSCVPCNCSPTGSTSTSCSVDGKCNCLSNFGGKQCDQCSPGYFKFPECLPCNCDESGAIGSTCDDIGQCHCKSNFDGIKCDKCKEQFYNYPACEECNCDPRGVIASFSGCGSVPAGELCQCKDRVQGRICNDCRPLFWNLQEYNPLGCEECSCYIAGTLGGLGACNTRSGQCMCKLHVGERKCEQCQDGFYKLENHNMFGCTACDCDVGGSIDNNCDKSSGQCRCHSRVEGRRCDRPIRAHYFPTLHQFQYEAEEGLTQSGPVRYRNSDDVFPGYSWKGYVVFSMLQNEVINVVHISKSSLYRMVLKYANLLKDPVTTSIIITPESVIDTKQSFIVHLRPTHQPQLVTVLVEKGNAPAPFVMNAGNWTVTIKTTKEIMIDYFVLIPEAYYEATVLTKLVDTPCIIGENKLCRHFAYPNLGGRPKATVSDMVVNVTSFIDDPEQLKEYNVKPNEMPIINNVQNELHFNMKIYPSGRYIMIIEYVTPVNRTALTISQSNSTEHYELSPRGVVTMRFQSGDGPESNALANLNDCPYTTPCRQVVVDDLSKIYSFNIQEPNNVVYLDGDTGTLAGIKSIIAIPESEWHLDYIIPRPYCLRHDGRCSPAVFSTAVDSKKVEIESGTGGDRDLRPPILDNSTIVVYLAPGSDSVKIESKVPSPGDYMFVVHYYQPDHPESNMKINLTTDGQQYDASIAVEHCPSNSGCRALIKQTEGNTQFSVSENFTIEFKGGNSKEVWLDYVLVIANPDFKDSVLKEANMIDYTREFIEKCAMNHYYIATNETGFCRDAMFSITAEYNSGALSCFCDFLGSTELECNTFGGQCPCKDNVVGRTCSACRTGYYGFPNCRPCHCPSTAICDENGECICPKNVEGENCDRCKPYTFNFDVQRGCDDCNCNPLGIVDNQLQCEADSGNCECKENVIGRVCDHCVPGHYAFPDCLRCTCNEDGTTDDVCDQNTAQCFCKKHVRGQDCSICKEEYFNLQSDNPDGCTKCYCFGKTTRCSSSYLSWAEINGMSDWYLVNMETSRTLNIYPLTISPNVLNDSVIGADLASNEDGLQKVVYFGAPNYYLGKRLTSYGGYLTYSIFYTTRENGHAIAAPDVIIEGSNGFIVHNSIEQPPSVENWVHSVRISENEFTNIDGSPISRDQFMNVLVNITNIYIRATYWHEAVTTRLMGVTLDIGEEEYNAMPDRRALSIEECQCPKAYRGLSCEQCAEGHYRVSSGPHAGFCVPCQCNGHSKECDVNTGICLGCTDNTEGDHCEQCISGYHGDATIGTPRDCLICACPIPNASNNFAYGCDLSDNGSLISCICKPGYGGARCEYCAAGYYGIPERIGDYCKPCNCSGNINTEDPGSCDSITGNCLKCVNNTAGAACNLCAPGFFGDAIFSKNCTACVCDDYGMERCDPTTGTCVCRPGVIGAMCDQCLPDYWGLKSGQGCTACNCGIASESTQCDDNTGKCRCEKGVTGTHCDQCAAGYWNYTRKGCDRCNCNKGYSIGFMCNATGQCECLPGVIGEKCDRCPDRWVLIPQDGCLECDSCTDALIFTVEDLRDLLSNETFDFKDKADSFFTTQRLNYISNQTELLKPKVTELRNVELSEVTSAVKALETNAKNLLRSAEFAATDSDKQILRAADLTNTAGNVLASVRENSDKAKEVVSHVSDIATGLELSQQPKIDSALSEARQIKSDIAEKNLKPKEVQAVNAYINASQQVERMNIFVIPVNEQVKKFESLINETRKLKSKLQEMLEYTDLAEHIASEAENLNANNRKAKFENKVSSVTKLNSAAMKDLIDSAFDISNATLFTGKTKEEARNMSLALENIQNTNANMSYSIETIIKSLPELTNLTNEAVNHARNLRNRAENLRNLADRENNNSRTQHAYSAASAYSSIVQEISHAENASEEAEAAVIEITDVNNRLNNTVEPARARSLALSKAALKALEIVEQQLKPNLTLAKEALTNASFTFSYADDENNAIQLSLPLSPQITLGNETNKADTVAKIVNSTIDTMSHLSSELSNSKEWAQTLPKLADDAQKMTSNVESLITDIRNMDPIVQSKLENVQIRQSELEYRRKDAEEKLQKLRELIEQARTVANRIQVGVTFDRHSTLQPRLPDTIDEMSTSTHVSAYFRTKEKDGFLLYLGNPKDTMLRRTKSDDFMVVGIQNGYPYLIMDIGDSAESGREPARISSDKFVADNRWYQVIVDRVGRNVKLSIRESLDNGSEKTYDKDAVLPGQHTIFNLDREKSKLYVGGVPSNAKLQSINFPAFEGQIEELMIGDTPVGLWNSVSAANLKGARQRDKLITSQSGPQEYRFNGRSHVTMPGRGYIGPQKNQVLLFFRTYAPDGLIYVVGEDKHFFSLQMQDGHVYLQVSLGDPSNMVILGTLKTYNDGKWHKLDAGRYSTSCSLRVDNEIVKKVAISPDKEILALDTMNFGGNNKGIIQVTTKGFDGCLRQISIDGINIDLSENIESVGIAYSCQFASLVSLSGDNSYLWYKDITTEHLQLTLKFKTSDPDGLLFIYISRTQTTTMPDGISLSLKKGKLVLMSQREVLDTGLNTYNDSQWHVVSVTHNNKALRLVVDDFDYFSTDSPPAPLHILDGVLFIGGVKANYVVGGKVGSKATFKGCIADASINGRVLNLLEPFSNHSVTFGRCGKITTTGGVPPDQTLWPVQAGDVLPTPKIIPEQEGTTQTESPLEPPERPITEPPTAPPPVTTTVLSSTRTPFINTTTRRSMLTTRKMPPQPETGCALAYDPQYTIGDPEEGYRFGTKNDSRIEYAKLPGRQLDGFDLTITFRTFDQHGGLMFYAAAERAPGQFLALYMKEAKLHFSFNCGGATGEVISTGTYSDTDWHTVTLVRNGGHGKLTVVNEWIGEASVTCNSPAVLTAPFYYGGLRNVSNSIGRNLKNFYQPFKGCLKGLMMNAQYVTDILLRSNSLRCTDNVEGGVYFGPSSNGHSNYLKLLENFRIGYEISISMEVKPRNSTGLLLSVHGRKDYMVLELMENEVLANVENGRGNFSASYKLGNKFSLCDGNWHKIHAVKSHHVVSVGVDGHFSDPGLGVSGSTDTRSAIYIGGHERPINRVRGVRSKRGFTGCIRNITIKDNPVQIPLSAAGRNTNIGICPSD
ncbi:laminin subunit alpha [Maniola hyperantus]|uniref:laminin subunit alpha n=1 Tax=Aphantopus hyperantus TaxID=2795564 RepID=UPI00156A0E73|nr:laminin subunit alpha [Maniola hyperantus]